METLSSVAHFLENSLEIVELENRPHIKILKSTSIHFVQNTISANLVHNIVSSKGFFLMSRNVFFISIKSVHFLLSSFQISFFDDSILLIVFLSINLFFSFFTRAARFFTWGSVLLVELFATDFLYITIEIY